LEVLGEESGPRLAQGRSGDVRALILLDVDEQLLKDELVG
jgi:hypothetical protein